jgi:hypothetical protein
MRGVTLVVLSAFAVLATPAAAEPGKPDKPDKPVANKDVSATDVVTTPATDLNIKKTEIPLLLVDAEQRPYALRGLNTCQQIGGAITQLDEVLGDDVDLPQNGERRMKPGRVAQSVVGSFIPFRGIIRELSGANEHDRQLQAAVIAGVARRSFLKGVGQSKGCRYPARSATIDVYNQRLADLTRGDQDSKRSADASAERQQRDGSGGRFVSQPVVQGTN